MGTQDFSIRFLSYAYLFTVRATFYCCIRQRVSGGYWLVLNATQFAIFILEEGDFTNFIESKKLCASLQIFTA